MSRKEGCTIGFPSNQPTPTNVPDLWTHRVLEVFVFTLPNYWNFPRCEMDTAINHEKVVVGTLGISDETLRISIVTLRIIVRSDKKLKKMTFGSSSP